jgi:hypothetical protein
MVVRVLNGLAVGLIPRLEERIARVRVNERIAHVRSDKRVAHVCSRGLFGV